MINELSFFSSFPFPWVIVNNEQDILAQSDGALFLFSNLYDQSITEEHCKRTESGWSVCPNGLACFTQGMPNSKYNKFICFGLKVKGISTIKGKSNVLSIKTTKEDIEKLVSKIFDAFSKVENELKYILRSSIHEVRSINTDIYHSALGTEKKSQFGKEKALKDIVALSGLLKDRIDFLDVISNPLILSVRGGKSDIYRMFDKVVRSLYSSARQKSISIRISGNTQGRVDGIQLFSVIPYLMLQNALKYAPGNSKIEVNLREDEDTIYIITTSFGPLIEKEEINKVFQSGFRGKHAIKYEKDGTGIGLYFLKQLVELHDGGQVKFYQEPASRKIKNINFAETHFHLRFTRAD